YQDADEVVFRVGAAVFDNAGQIGGVFRQRHSRSEHGFDIVHAADSGDHGVRPAVKLFAVFGIDADHIGNKLQGQRHGDILREVALAFAADAIKRFRYLLAELLFQLADHARRESAAEEFAQLAVARFAIVD